MMSSGWTFTDWLQYLFSFALVIGLLLCMLWGLRKLQNGSGLLKRPHQRLKMVETLSLAPRQKIALIRVDNQEVLVGITAQQITVLHTPLSQSLPAETPENSA
jgi:flagellar protein FliO/FliZ